MALKVERVGSRTTTDMDNKPMQCWTCHERKTGLFGIDPNGRPRCADCAKEAGRPIPGAED
jgi:hypothetical protein